MTSEPADGRSRRFAHRRQELLDLATEHVAKNGLADLRLRTVADAVGVSHRTLLHHFGTKEQLISEVLAELRERDRALLSVQAEALVGVTPDDLIVRAWNQLSNRASRPYWHLFFQTYGAAMQDRERYQVFMDGIVTDWLELITAQLEQAGVPDARQPALATIVLAGYRGVLLDLLATDDDERAAAAINELAQLVHNARNSDGAQ